MFDKAKRLFQELQSEICSQIEKLEGSCVTFSSDKWQKEDGFGQGTSRVLKGGSIFEQAGVNWSQFCGRQLPPSVLSKFPELKGKKFYVTGISLVIHPLSPMCPTVHANYRFFQVMESESSDHSSVNVAKWWFGGGMDLTPYYLFDEDAEFFHRSIKESCDAYDADFFPIYSNWANKYFFLKHRQEHRGIGGLFFDYISDDIHLSPLYRINEDSFEFSPELKLKSEELFLKKKANSKQMYFSDLFSFVSRCGFSFSPVYSTIIERRKDYKYTDAQKHWQLYRRGRYVEFNLLYDRGTVFGLQTGGRVESILMSLPPMVRFEYCYSPQEGSEEDRLLQVLKYPKCWC
uniref:coproporphyrinogen oxidase n=1 Tax=Perkinsela sp. SMB-60 TaxID=1840652 RepID=A0A167HCY4_9EUGL|nr:coproporphyrinogen III oxidase [Perkinsela sp. SMB-60]